MGGEIGFEVSVGVGLEEGTGVALEDLAPPTVGLLVLVTGFFHNFVIKQKVE